MSKVEMGGNLQQDISGSEQGEQESGLELVHGQELDVVVDVANDLAGKIEGDKKITGDDVLKLDEVLGKVKIEVGGDEMTVDEARKIPDLKKNMEIWQKIQEGELYMRDLTYITSSPMGRLLDNILDQRGSSTVVDFERLKALTDGAATEIGDDCNDMRIYFESIIELSDKAVEELCRSKARTILLPNLYNVSERSLKLLAESELTFTGNSYSSKQKEKINVSEEMQKRIEEYRAKNKK